MSVPWMPSSLPEDQWSTEHGPIHSSATQPSGGDWNGQHSDAWTQELGSNVPTTWTPSFSAVETGVSHASSYDCQSTRTLDAQPHGFILHSPQPDFVAASQPDWTGAGHLYPTSYYMQQPLPGDLFAPNWENDFTGPVAYAPVATWTTTQPPLYSPSGYVSPLGDGVRPDNTVLPQPVLMHRRPLLPRTQAPMTAPIPAQGLTPSQRHIRPLIRGRVSPQCPSDSVSKVQQRSPGIFGHAGAIPLPLTPPVLEPPRTCAAALDPTPAPAVQREGTSALSSGVPDPAADEFNSFIRYDQDETVSVLDSSRLANGIEYPYIAITDAIHSADAGRVSRIAVSAPQSSPDRPSALPTPDTVTERAATASNQTASSEVDEGRHRNHALYSRGLEPDGLFHCPFKAKEDCPHKPTKLKCNYDKFIDSHLKPFRCKNEACVKQEFSSTACLLRHEREAHGMHGHGERPHLCLYPGCERGFAGNGFPRRYNLFDHMKRVHDHKEEAQSGRGSPDNVGIEPPKVVGRKRKAPSSTTSEPATQRRKMSPLSSGSFPRPTFPAPSFLQTSSHGPTLGLTHPVGPQSQSHSPVIYGAPQMGSFTPPVTVSVQPSMQHAHASRQWNVHAQWARQKDLLARQLEHGLPDEAGMERLDRDFREYRRLSDEARHG